MALDLAQKMFLDALGRNDYAAAIKTDRCANVLYIRHAIENLGDGHALRESLEAYKKYCRIADPANAMLMDYYRAYEVHIDSPVVQNAVDGAKADIAAWLHKPDAAPLKRPKPTPLQF